jgi:hypothetical protein
VLEIVFHSCFQYRCNVNMIGCSITSILWVLWNKCDIFNSESDNSEICSLAVLPIYHLSSVILQWHYPPRRSPASICSESTRLNPEETSLHWANAASPTLRPNHRTHWRWRYLIRKPDMTSDGTLKGKLPEIGYNLLYWARTDRGLVYIVYVFNNMWHM